MESSLVGYMACTNSSVGTDHSQVRQRKQSSQASVSDVESLKPKSETELPILRLWNKIVVVSCVIAVLTDPLFFYIPLINDKNKCLGMDKNLRIVALLLRSLTDIIFIIDITHQVRCRIKNMVLKVSKDSSPSNSSTSSQESEKIVALDVLRLRQLSVSIITHFLAVLPFPQVSVLFFFFRMGDTGYLSRRQILNAFLLFQYVPNIYRLRLSYMKLHITQRSVRGAFNFFSYIVASHVVGAFWYFFSIQRETSCWYQACGNIEGCIPTQCNDNTSTNITNVAFLNESCPISPLNATLFDFGMYGDTLQSGYTRQRSFPKKFIYSFWWGLKNLSNFGTNLVTSSYVWENGFAVLISITGLLLFLYLIGNVQVYMQFSKSNEMNKEHEEELNKKMKEKENEILKYLKPRDGVPPDMLTEIMGNIKHSKLKNKLDSDVDMEFIFSLLPWNVGIYIMRHIGMRALKKVPMVRDMDEVVLHKICERLRPVSYISGHVFKVDTEIDSMLFITEGSIRPITLSGEDHSTVTVGEETFDYFGEQLLWWVSPSISFSGLTYPTRARELKCQTKVEAFILFADDLKTVVKGSRRIWNRKLYDCDTDFFESEELAPSLPKNYERYIQFWKAKLISAQNRKIRKDIIDWMSRTGLSKDVDKEIRNYINENNMVKTCGDVAVDLQFLFSVLPQKIKYAIGIHALRKVPMLEKIPDEKLESICRYLEPVIYDENMSVIQAGTKLDMMLFVVEGIMICTSSTSDALTSYGIPKVSIPKLYLEKGDIYGEEVMSWATSITSRTRGLPICTQDFKCHKKIEAFSLKASQLQNAVSKIDIQWSEYYIPPPAYENKTYLQKLKELHRQLKTTTTWKKIEDREFKHKMDILDRENDILDWLLRHALPDDVATNIIKIIKENKEVEKNIDFHMDVEYLLSIDLPWNIEKSVRHHLSLPALKKVPVLQQMPNFILESICKYLTPAVYDNNCYVAEKGKALDLMLIIIEGEIALTDTKTDDAGITDSSVTTTYLKKGDIFGTEILNWVSPKKSFARQYAQCKKNVEAFTLTTRTLRLIVSDACISNDCQNTEQLLIEYDDKWESENSIPEEIDSDELRQEMSIKNKENEVFEWMSTHKLDDELKEKVMLYIRINNSVGPNMNSDVDVKYLFSLITWVLAKPIAQKLCKSALKKVPMLQTMHDDVLEKMCFHVQAVVYDQNICIVEKGQSLDFMLIIVEGIIEWTETAISDAGTIACRVITKRKGEIFGEQCLHRASFSGATPNEIGDVKCRSKVEAFYLSTKDLRSVVSEYDDVWKYNSQNSTDAQKVEEVMPLQNNIDKCKTIDSEETDSEELRQQKTIRKSEWIEILEWISKPIF